MKDYPQWWEDRLTDEVRDIATKLGVREFDLMRPWDDLDEETQDRIKEMME